MSWGFSSRARTLIELAQARANVARLDRRDAFARIAMQELLRSSIGIPESVIAKMAYRMADAMMDAANAKPADGQKDNG